MGAGRGIGPPVDGGLADCAVFKSVTYMGILPTSLIGEQRNILYHGLPSTG